MSGFALGVETNLAYAGLDSDHVGV